MSDQHIAYSEAGTSFASSVLLLLDNKKNQQLLAEQLGAEGDIQTPADDPFENADFDLCVVDTQSLADYADQLREVKSTAAPTFLPYLLLTEHKHLGDFSETIWKVIDEVIQQPVAKAELDARIANLLQRRYLSLELTREKKQNEQRFETLFESTPDPVVVVTPEGTITEVNEAFVTTFDFDPGSVTGRSLDELELDTEDALERVILRITEDNPSTKTVTFDLGKEDSLVTELRTDIVSGLSDSTERIGIFRDITEHSEREEELERQNERLEEFAETIAHDLRNPLSVARGHLELARETGDEHFVAVEQSHERIEQMIDELLTLAKQGQVVLEPDMILLEDIVTQSWQHVETQHAALELELDQSDEIIADQGRLCELFENLFRNAIDHVGDDVTVRVGCLTDGSGVFIEDDGPGIPPDQRRNVFEAGYTDAHAGTGFGLSIVHQIVDGHGWEISITESDSGGARFEITGLTFAE